MGNLFSSEDDLNDKTYSVKDLLELENDLGRIVYKNNDEVEINFSELNINKENFSNFSNVSNGDLVGYLKNIEDNLFTNYNEESWLQKQLDNELLDNNVLKVEFNSILPNNYENYNYLLDLINFDNNESDDVSDDERKIIELYKGNSTHIFKDEKLLGKPLYGKVELDNIYLSYDNKLGLYSKYDDNIKLSNALNLEWYLVLLKNGNSYVIFNNYYFNGIEDNNIIVYDNRLLEYVINANKCYNTNVREFESYVNQFNKYVENLKDESNEDTSKIVVMLGDSYNGGILRLDNFIQNFNFEI